MKRPAWWLWTLATIAILGTWITFASAIAGALEGVGPQDADWWQLLTQLATFIPFLLATPLAWRYLLGQPWATLVNERGRIEWRRIRTGFAAWMLLAAASTAVDAILSPEGYRFSFEAGRFALFALVVIVFLPLQTSAEELFFRGWVLRWAGRLPAASRIIISGVVFSLPHAGNPEAATDTWLALTAYFLLGAGWAWASVRDGGIELALGAHLANNAFSLLIVGYDNAALPTSAVFTTNRLDLLSTAIAMAVAAPLFVTLTRRR